MITGKYSALKFAALFGLTLLAVLDVIFGTTNRTVGIINSLLVAGLLGGAVFKLYQLWKDKE